MAVTVQATDADLIDRARSGDDDAFGMLVERHQTVAFRTAYVICGQAADGFWPGSWFDRAMRHVDREGLVERGAPLFAIVDELRIGLYVTPATTAAIDGSGELFHTRLKNIDWKRQSDGAIDALFANGQKIAEARLAAFGR